MTATTGANLLIGLAVLALILYRQLQARPVRDTMRLPLILTVIGVVELAKFLQHGHHGAGVLVALAGSLVIAAVFGVIRAATVHVWVDGGRAWRQGTWLTAVLWVVSLGVHLGYDYLVDGKGSQAGLGSASLLLYFGVTFTIQRLILQARAQRIAAATPEHRCAHHVLVNLPGPQPDELDEPAHERSSHQAITVDREPATAAETPRSGACGARFWPRPGRLGPVAFRGVRARLAARCRVAGGAGERALPARS